MSDREVSRATRDLVVKGLLDAIKVHEAEIARLNEEEGKVCERLCAPCLTGHAVWSLTLTYTECENKITKSRESIRNLRNQVKTHIIEGN